MIKNERGFSLIEVLVAVALLGIIAAFFLMALSTASRALLMADVRTTGESLARSQMEYVKSQPYDGTNNPPQYALLSDNIPDGYAISITAERLDPKGDGTANDDGIQKITVTIKHHDEEVIRLEGFKLDR
ncbi:type II secretion system GspH family protein [Dehalococcoidia bacterium]|nr:type II secretion system GspH family protein [Dehalococcoidia bacterium]MCL0091091.1 type II secretion system GspH family protein [Dehalococcoidia bacterium]